MPTLTVVHQSTSGNAFGTGAYTTASFTPGSGRRLLVVCQAQSQADDAFEGTALTISDSDSSITSWTSITATASSPAWGYGSRAWVSDQGASGSSMTVSLDAGSTAIENYRVTVWDIQDYGGTGAIIQTTSSNFLTPVSITLSGAPASSSVVVACANVGLGGGTSTVTPASGWTEVEDTTRDSWYNFQIQTRTGSTSTSVDWDDLATGASPIGAALMAFEITHAAGGGGATVAPIINVVGM